MGFLKVNFDDHLAHHSLRSINGMKNFSGEDNIIFSFPSKHKNKLEGEISSLNLGLSLDTRIWRQI